MEDYMTGKEMLKIIEVLESLGLSGDDIVKSLKYIESTDSTAQEILKELSEKYK